MNIVLNNVKYVPKLAPCNLFSIAQAILSGWMLGNEGKTILLKNGKSVLKFNKILKKKSGYVGGTEILLRVDDNIAAPALSPGKGADIMKFHDMLGHVSESTTKKTARCAFGIAHTDVDLCPSDGKTK
jgi:flavoprotein